MATYLLTVERVERTEQGLRLSPGIRLSRTTDRVAIGQITQGASLELRRADGTTQLTRLVTYGVSAWRGEDGSLDTNEDPSDPEIKLVIPADLSLEVLATGTEVWLPDGLDG